MQKIKVYGANWCAMTTGTLDHLRRRGIPFDYIDIERDPAAAAWVKQQNGGKERKPTVDIGGQILSEPTHEELDAALESAGEGSAA